MECLYFCVTVHVVCSYLTPMRRAMSMEQMGSAIIRSYLCIRKAEMMTPMLPNVSATMCRKTPAGHKKTHQTYV